jgi:hypothetical protein
MPELERWLAAFGLGRADLSEYDRTDRRRGAKLGYLRLAPADRAVHRADRNVVMGELIAAIAMIIVIGTLVAVAVDAIRRA